MSPVGRKGRLEPAGVGRNGRGVLEGVVLGFEPMAPSMLGKHSATELHLHPSAVFKSTPIMEGLAVCPCPAKTARLQYCVRFAEWQCIHRCMPSVCVSSSLLYHSHRRGLQIASTLQCVLLPVTVLRVCAPQLPGPQSCKLGTNIPKC